jgi:hypothetical protein
MSCAGLGRERGQRGCLFIFGKGTALVVWGEMQPFKELRGFRIMQYSSRGVGGDSFEVVFMLDVGCCCCRKM